MKKNFQYTNQHSVPKIFNPNVTTPSTFTKFYRSTSCPYICKTNTCTNCQKFENQKTLYVQKSIKKQEVMNLIPAKTKAPISKTSAERLKLAFQHYRTENKFLKEKIDELQSEINNPSIEVSAELSGDMVTIMSSAD